MVVPAELQEKVDTVLKNIAKCKEAILLENVFSNKLFQLFNSNKPPIMTCEDSVLNLACSHSTKGIFMCNVLACQINNKEVYKAFRKWLL